MSRSRAYKRTDVKQIDLAVLRERTLEFGNAGVTVDLDIGKSEIVACLRWPHGDFERPWSIRNPEQIPVCLEVLKLVKSVGDSMTVGLESTGTYGEAMRRGLTVEGIEVHRISGKATYDYQEIFDGVPSQHDGKHAAVIAELTAYGKKARLGLGKRTVSFWRASNIRCSGRKPTVVNRFSGAAAWRACWRATGRN